MRTEFETNFSYRTAIAYEPGVTRRDPSPGRAQRFSSKSDAAYWGIANGIGDCRFVLPLAASVRKNPSLYTEEFKARHLERLVQATREAWSEVSRQIEKYITLP